MQNLCTWVKACAVMAEVLYSICSCGAGLGRAGGRRGQHPAGTPAVQVRREGRPYQRSFLAGECSSCSTSDCLDLIVAAKPCRLIQIHQAELHGQS